MFICFYQVTPSNAAVCLSFENWNEIHFNDVKGILKIKQSLTAQSSTAEQHNARQPMGHISHTSNKKIKTLKILLPYQHNCLGSSSVTTYLYKLKYSKDHAALVVHHSK